MALTGRHLKVGAGIWSPWVVSSLEPDGSVVYSGFIFSFFDEIARRLNFTYSISSPADGEWGRLLPNGSFTGIIGMCERKDVDLILGPVSATWERFQVADFSVAIYTDSYKIFLPRPRFESDLSSITRPFAMEVWVLLAIILSISLVIAPFLSFVMNKGTLNRLESYQNQRDRTIDLSWIIRILFTEAITTLPRSSPSRMYLTSWMIGGFILQIAYSGVLTSILAVPKIKIPVDSLQDLVDYNKIPWIMEKGIAIHNSMMKSQAKIHKTILEKTAFVSFAIEAKDMVKDDGMAIITDVFSMKMMMSEDFTNTGECSYYIATESLTKDSLGLGFPKGSDIVLHFDKWLTTFKESGMITKLLEGVTANATACLAKPGSEKSQAKLVFSVVDLAAVFLLMAAGAVIGFAFLMIEKMTHQQGVWK